MEADYQEIYDSIDNKPFLMTTHGFSYRVQYVELNVTSGLSDYHSDIAQISMAIQKSKYDGSDEKFNDWVVWLDAENSCCDSTLAEEPQNEANHE